MSDDMARRPQIRISVVKRRQNSGSTRGAMKSSPTTMAKPIQKDRVAVRAEALVPARRPLRSVERLCGMRLLRRGDEEAGGPEEEGQDEGDESHDHGLGRAHD